MIPLLSIAYLPPVPYIATCIRSEEIVIELHEHYIKQTYRNRALIYGANGILPLIIPIQHKDLFDIPVEEVKISYDVDWQKIHWRSIVSAYRNSAFFEYFEDDFDVFYQRKFQTLCEFDLELLKLVFRILQSEVVVSFTSGYHQEVPGKHDLREAFNMHDEDQPNQKPPEMRYRQVFSSKHGFLPNLSIIDLLFNEGPESRNYLSRISQP